jgi:membrane-bound ClpP family serine protease
MKKAFIWHLGVLALIACVLVGVWLLRGAGNNSSSANVPTIAPDNGGVVPPEAQAQIAGQIITFSASEITVAPVVPPGSASSKPVAGQPFAVSSEHTTYVVTASTRITKQVLRDRATFETELAAYQKSRTGAPPMAYTDKILTPQDLKAGMIVTVVPTTATSHTAATILVVAPAPAQQ